MTEQISTGNFDAVPKTVPVKELLLISIPVSIIFAISGMDFIGYFIYLSTRTSRAEIYTRSLVNVLVGFLITTISLLLIPFIVNRLRWKKPLSYFGCVGRIKKAGIPVYL